MLPGIERQPRKKLEPSPERLLTLLHGWRDEVVRAGCTITRIALAFEAGRAERQRPRIAARALRFREWAVSGRAGAGNTRYRHVLRTRRETRQSSRRMLR